MKKRTYAVDGLLSYSYRLNAGEAWFYVKFEGTRSAGFGGYRALYSTTDPLEIKLIEASDDFKRGKIYRLE